MDLEPVPLRFFGSPTDVEPLAWQVVEGQLSGTGTYWIAAGSDGGHPHPRPVWGVWSPADDGGLWLSIGSPRVAADVAARPLVTAHLDSGVEVVIIEGTAAIVDDAASIARFVAAYDVKYEWNYTVDEYGPPTRIQPTSVIAWRSAGWAGRDGFAEARKWRHT